jgi:hypothetical protein
MSSWAEIDEDSKVIRVTVGDNNDPNGDEGYQWLIDNLGGTWVQTSFSGSFRYNFAAVGFTYDPIDDAFIAPAPCEHDSLLLNDLKRWECATCEADFMQGWSAIKRTI